MTATPHESPSAGQRYLIGVVTILGEIAVDQWPAIRAAAAQVADTVAGGGLVHVFGTGHSHMLAEELFYRAGGLAAVNPILVGSLMLHAGAENSTLLERQEGLAETIFADLPLKRGDTLIVASNSGGNAVCEEMAQLAHDAGARIVAIISRRHAHHSASQGDKSQLLDLADLVIDNHGDVGDASVDIEGLGRRVAPTSTVAGAAILNAIVAESVEILVGRGVAVDVFSSSNVAGGDAANAELVARYRNRVKAL
ncbi:MAG: SIS domain-containing protein [Acidimicrobiia bacterium]